MVLNDCEKPQNKHHKKRHKKCHALFILNGKTYLFVIQQQPTYFVTFFVMFIKALHFRRGHVFIEAPIMKNRSAESEFEVH